MEAASSGGGGIHDFSFGFDDANYSDRTLLLEIMDEVESDDDRTHNVKRRRRNNLLMTPTTDSVEPPPRVKSIHINSLILAARSPFFRKMFSNGMQESEHKRVTLRIETSEEVSLMDLLKYIYSNNVPTSLYALLDLLVIADKFEVDSCSRDCAQALQKLPMTCESASVYLDLPPCLMISPIVEPLLDAAKQFLVAEFKDLHKFTDEMLNMSLACIQVVLSSDDVRVNSEDVVYDFVLAWVHKHYPDLEERREILKTHILHLVRFPFMTIKKLTEEVQTCRDIDPQVASNIVTRALVFKAETPHQKHSLAANAVSRQFVERAYKYRPVKMVEFEVPHLQCIVFLDLKKEELTHVQSCVTTTESFHLGKQRLSLTAERFLCKRTNSCYLELGLKVCDSANFTVKYEVALRKKPAEDFGSWYTGSHTFTETDICRLLNRVLWTGFIEDDSSCFINKVLYVRVNLTLKS